MKGKIVFAIALLFSSLTGCNSYKVPTNNYDKVKTAFNGVEKSFKKIQPKKANYNLELLPKRKNLDNGLSTIFNYFGDSDIKGHSLDDLGYNEPPMIQFQYLKAVFDKAGSGYEFGTKYYETINGEVYLDIETGFEDEDRKDENKYTYDFDLALDITINDNDLINADVSFDIVLTKNQKTYGSSRWYVNLQLEYDMEKASPTYKLAMYTENDETNLPYYNHLTYEYDYVDVEDSKITEWRKFCMHANERLILDANHPSLNEYINKDGFEYKVDYPKWFKNGNYYKLERMTNSMAASIGNALYTDVGLNANDINADPFFAKQGKRNNDIQDIYKKFTTIAKHDIIYDLMCRDKDNQDHGGGETREAKHIIAMNEDGTGRVDNYSIPDTAIHNIFIEGYSNLDGHNERVTLWYADINKEPLGQIPDTAVGNLTYGFGVLDNNNVLGPVIISFNTLISEAYAMIKNQYNLASDLERCRLFFQDAEISGYMDFRYTGEFPDTYVAPTFPEDLTKLGIPSYTSTTNKIEFKYDRNGENYRLTVTNTGYDDAEPYLTAILKAGFEKNPDAQIGSLFEHHYRKSYNDEYYLLVQVTFVNGATQVIIDVSFQEKPSSGGQGEDDNLVIQSLELLGDFNGWEIGTGYPFTNNDGRFELNNVQLTQGTKFKLVANENWEIHSKDTAYGGFGFDDIEGMDSKGQDCLERAEGPDGNIRVKRDCTFNVAAVVAGDVLRIKVSGFRY